MEVELKKRRVILELVTEVRFVFERRFELNVNPECDHQMAERLATIILALPDKFNDKKIVIERPTKLCSFNWDTFAGHMRVRPELTFKMIWLAQFKTT